MKEEIVGQLAPKAPREQLDKRAPKAPKAQPVIQVKLAPQDLAEVKAQLVLLDILVKTMEREQREQWAPSAPGAQPAVKVRPEVTAKLAVMASTVSKALLGREAMPDHKVPRVLMAQWVQMV